MKKVPKKSKNKIDIIIKLFSYAVATIIVAYTIRNGAESNYQHLFYEIGKAATIIGVIVLIIAGIWAGYKIATYIRSKNIDQHDNEKDERK